MKSMIFGAVSVLALNAAIDLNGNPAMFMHAILPAEGFTSPQYLMILGICMWLYVTVGRQHLLLMSLLSTADDPLFNDYANRGSLPTGQKLALYAALGIQIMLWPAVSLAALFAPRSARR